MLAYFYLGFNTPPCKQKKKRAKSLTIVNSLSHFTQIVLTLIVGLSLLPRMISEWDSINASFLHKYNEFI